MRPQNHIKWIYIPALLLALAACGGGGQESPNRSSTTDSGGQSSDGNGQDAGDRQTAACDNPMAPEVQEHTVVSNLPNSYDQARTDDATESPTTTFFVAVHLPERCPDDVFPVVIQSHGYSGSRNSERDEDGAVDPAKEHFPAIDELFSGLSVHGYVGISYEQRGHGDSIPDNGGGYARVIDPEAETQDGIALLDWVASNADTFFVQT